MRWIKRWLRRVLAIPVFLVRLALLVPLGGLVYPVVILGRATRYLWLILIGLIVSDYKPGFYEVGVMAGILAFLGFFGEALVIPLMAKLNPFTDHHGGVGVGGGDDLRAEYDAVLLGMHAQHQEELARSYQAGRRDAEEELTDYGAAR